MVPPRRIAELPVEGLGKATKKDVTDRKFKRPFVAGSEVGWGRR